jgi:dihydrofolate reductase
MIISLLVAMDERRGIGLDNRLPWHLSSDLRMFKSLTIGRHLIMGRKTFESIGKALPGRRTVVLSRDPDYRPEGTQTAASLEEALALARDQGEQEAFVVGGSEVFTLAMPYADRLYLTRVHAVTPADVFFPEFDQDEWVETRTFFQPADDKNEYAFTFQQLERKRSV